MSGWNFQLHYHMSKMFKMRKKFQIENKNLAQISPLSLVMWEYPNTIIESVHVISETWFSSIWTKVVCV